MTNIFLKLCSLFFRLKGGRLQMKCMSMKKVSYHMLCTTTLLTYTIRIIHDPPCDRMPNLFEGGRRADKPGGMQPPILLCVHCRMDEVGWHMPSLQTGGFFVFIQMTSLKTIILVLYIYGKLNYVYFNLSKLRICNKLKFV